MTTWEDRMAAKAKMRADAEEAARHLAALDDERRRQEIFEQEHPPRWVEHTYDAATGMAVDERGWPDFTSCRRCFEHDDQGRLHQQAYRPYWHVWGGSPIPAEPCWEAIQICAHSWETVDDTTRRWDGWRWEHVGCGCFCHHLDHAPVAIAAAG